MHQGMVARKTPRKEIKIAELLQKRRLQDLGKVL